MDRNDWVSLGDLVEGENLATELGPISVSSLELYRTTEPVYNFETHGEHVYQVTQLGLLVHNAYPKGVRGAAKKQGGVYVWKKNGEVIRTGRTKDLVRRAKEHAKKLKELGATMETVFKTNSRNIQRGLAHILNQKHNARLDKAREIASRNPNMSTYVRAARDFLRRQG